MVFKPTYTSQEKYNPLNGKHLRVIAYEVGYVKAGLIYLCLFLNCLHLLSASLVRPCFVNVILLIT